MNKLLRMAETLPDAPPLALPSTFSHSPDRKTPMPLSLYRAPGGGQKWAALPRQLPRLS